MPLMREFLDQLHESYAIHREFSGELPAEVAANEITPDTLARETRKRADLWDEVVMSDLRHLLWFIGFPMVMVPAFEILPEVLSGLLMIIYVVGFTYLTTRICIATNRYRFYRCPRCGYVFRDMRRIFADRERCRVCALYLRYPAIEKSETPRTG